MESSIVKRTSFAPEGCVACVSEIKFSRPVEVTPPYQTDQQQHGLQGPKTHCLALEKVRRSRVDCKVLCQDSSCKIIINLLKQTDKLMKQFVCFFVGDALLMLRLVVDLVVKLRWMGLDETKKRQQS